MKLGFIGTGKIASAVITGICTSKISFQKIIVSPRNRNIAQKLKKRFNGKKVVTFVKKFNKFYPAEDYHQDYYSENFMNYLLYKKACGREKTLQKIWKN